MTWQEIATLISFGMILLFFAVGFGICAAFFIWLMKEKDGVRRLERTMSLHSVYVDDEVLAELQKRATPLKDTSNRVLRRLLLPGEMNREILTVLHKKGPMMAKQLVDHVPYHLKSVYTKLLELETVGLVSRDGNGVWKAEPPAKVEVIGSSV